MHCQRETREVLAAGGAAVTPLGTFFGVAVKGRFPSHPGEVGFEPEVWVYFIASPTLQASVGRKQEAAADMFARAHPLVELPASTEERHISCPDLVAVVAHKLQSTGSMRVPGFGRFVVETDERGQRVVAFHPDVELEYAVEEDAFQRNGVALRRGSPP